MLLPKLQEFSDKREKDPISALAILYIVEKFELNPKYEQYMPLFKALVQEDMDFKEITQSFEDEYV